MSRKIAYGNHECRPVEFPVRECKSGMRRRAQLLAIVTARHIRMIVEGEYANRIS